MNCNGVKEGLVDFLYEDLPADARAAFEEHLRDCPTCKADVAGYRMTLGNARAALSGTLAQEPPVHVHNAVIEAAKAAAATRTASRERAPARQEPEIGFFAKLWRTPWLLPAFGAASVATVVFLVRALKDPEVLPGQRPKSIGELAEPRSPSTPAVAPTAEKSAAASAGHAKARREGSEPGAREEPLGAKAGAGKATRPAPGAARTHEESKGSPAYGIGGLPFERDGLSGLEADKSASPRAHKKMDRAVADDFVGEDSAARGNLSAPPRFAAPPPPSLVESVGGAAAQVEAEPKEVVGNQPELAPAKRAKAPTAASPRPTSPSAVPSVPAPAATVEPGPSAKRSAEKQSEAESEESYAPSAIMRAEDSSHKAANGQPGPALDQSMRRAERLFADQSWSAAAEAYRDLIRRYPGHKDANKWRARMDQSVIAEREAHEASRRAAKVKAAEYDTLQKAKE